MHKNISPQSWDNLTLQKVSPNLTTHSSVLGLSNVGRWRRCLRILHLRFDVSSKYSLRHKMRDQLFEGPYWCYSVQGATTPRNAARTDFLHIFSVVSVRPVKIFQNLLILWAVGTPRPSAGKLTHNKPHWSLCTIWLSDVWCTQSSNGRYAKLRMCPIGVRTWSPVERVKILTNLITNHRSMWKISFFGSSRLGTLREHATVLSQSWSIMALHVDVWMAKLWNRFHPRSCSCSPYLPAVIAYA